jgi:hypothetical protein
LIKNIELTKSIKKIKLIINEIKKDIENKNKQLTKKTNNTSSTNNIQDNNNNNINDFSKLMDGIQINPMLITLKTCVNQFHLSKKLFENYFSFSDIEKLNG